ncbi:MAG: type I secretion system permease/ATPase [Pseudomonadota bacterium]
MQPSHKPRSPLQQVLASAKRIFGSVGLFSFCINLLMLVGPLYMLQIYDRVLSSGSLPTLVYLTLVAVGLIFTSALLELVRARVLVRLGLYFEDHLQDTLFSGLFAARQHGADRSAQPLKDMDVLRTFLTGPGLITFFDAPWAPVFLAIIFVFHPVLGLIALGGALMLFTLAFVSEAMTRDLLLEASGANSAATRFTESALRNVEVVTALGMLPGLKQRWLRQHSKGLAAQAKASDRAGSLTAAAKFIRPCLQIAMLGSGAYLALLEHITPGVMIASSIIMGRALAPVEGAINSWRNFVLARAGFGRLSDFLALSEQDEKPLQLPAPVGQLTAEKLIAAPPGASDPVIKGISFGLEAGKCLGIIGPSAAGKSTLARLLVGVWQPSKGAVRLDGADISHWDPIALGPHLGYLPQDVELFDGTVADNICRFGEADAQAVIDAARAADVHDLILRLEKGYDTQIGAGGQALSGGQRQRIGLARALYGAPQLVVLDEPNSNLDSDGEEALRQALIGLKKRGATAIVIAHRPSVLSVVDVLMVLRGGMIEHFGPRTEVLPKVTRAVQAGGAKPKTAARA